MTHSHDTPTPAMSAETVPSEEFVLVPREPTERMLKAADGWTDLIDAAGENTAESRRSEFRIAWKAMVEAAPTLSASHLAKEGGETVVVPYDDFHAAYGFVPRSKMSPDQCLKTRLRSLLRAEDLAHVDEAEALASLPQPSPALAKGGDAVREALKPFAEAADKYDPPEDADDLLLAWAHNFTVGQLRRARAALSTPTEGPASQTEGMGGEPMYLVRKSGAFYRPNSQGYTHSKAEAGRYTLAEAVAITHPNGLEGPRDGMDFIAAPTFGAALTPPETAEAVPVGDAAQEAEAYIQAAVDRAPEPLRRLGEWLANKLDEDDWKTAERMLLGAATASDPAPATDDRERLVEADQRHPSMFYSPDRESRIGVAHYGGVGGPLPTVTVSTLLENRPGGRWVEVQLAPDEAEQMALHLLDKVASARAVLATEASR